MRFLATCTAGDDNRPLVAGAWHCVVDGTDCAMPSNSAVAADEALGRCAPSGPRS
jgi:hypothetical protein